MLRSIVIRNCTTKHIQNIVMGKSRKLSSFAASPSTSTHPTWQTSTNCSNYNLPNINFENSKSSENSGYFLLFNFYFYLFIFTFIHFLQKWRIGSTRLFFFCIRNDSFRRYFSIFTSFIYFIYYLDDDDGFQGLQGTKLHIIKYFFNFIYFLIRMPFMYSIKISRVTNLTAFIQQ